jgi:flavin reductase (DIM6/NTAB) family NADH-FMN oxidoreductase RutF
MSDLQDVLARITATLDYPMLIVTAQAGERRSGCLVGFATQCSIAPVRFLICISDKNRTFRVAHDADALGVHFVPRGARHLAELFGSETGDEVGKFERCSWHPGPGGVPILDACGRWFAGSVIARVPLGDHCGHVLEPFAAEAGDDGPLLGFSDVKQLDPGHDA